MNKYKDFDAFFQEAEVTKPITFKLFGKEEVLPPSLPAVIMLKLHRAYKENNGKLSEQAQLDIAFCIFGEDKIEQWCEQGLTIDQLTDLISWAYDQYGTNKETNGKK